MISRCSCGRDVLERLGVVPARVVGRDADDLVVLALLVLHHEQRDRLDRDHAAREGRLRDADHRVERIAVAAAVAHQEAVIGRVDHRRGEEAVEHQLADPLVELVLVAAPLRDLDEREQLAGYRMLVGECGPARRKAIAAGVSSRAQCDGSPRRWRPSSPRCRSPAAATAVLNRAPQTRRPSCSTFSPNAVHSGIYARSPSGDYDDAGVALTSASRPRPPTRRSCSPPAGRDFAILDIHDLGLARERGLDLVGVGAIVHRPLAAVIARDRDAVRTPRPTSRAAGRGHRPALRRRGARLGARGRRRRPRRRVDRVTIGFDAVAALAAGKLDAATAFWNAEGVALRGLGVPTREFRVDDFGAPDYPELILTSTRRDPARPARPRPRVVDATGAGYDDVGRRPAGRAHGPARRRPRPRRRRSEAPARRADRRRRVPARRRLRPRDRSEAGNTGTRARDPVQAPRRHRSVSPARPQRLSRSGMLKPARPLADGISKGRSPGSWVDDARAVLRRFRSVRGC